MAAVAHDGRCKCLEEFGAGFQRFADGFRAARVVIAGMHAILIYGRGGAHDAERIEEMDGMALLGEANCGGCAVDSRPCHRDLRAHEVPLATLLNGFQKSSRLRCRDAATAEVVRKNDNKK